MLKAKVKPHGDLEDHHMPVTELPSMQVYLEDGNIYGIDFNGNNLANWPQTIIGGISGNSTINSSPIFADIDNDGISEIITASEEGQLIIYHINGNAYGNNCPNDDKNIGMPVSFEIQ